MLQLSLRVCGALLGRSRRSCRGTSQLMPPVLLCVSVHCSQGERLEAVQDPQAIVHWAVASHRWEPGDGCSLAWDPASGELASHCVGPALWVGPALPVSRLFSPMLGKTETHEVQKLEQQALSQVPRLLPPFCLGGEWEMLPDHVASQGPACVRILGSLG